MKKVWALALAAVVALPLAVPSITLAQEVVLPGPGVKPEVVIDNDTNISLENETFVSGGRTYVPVKELSEKLGLHVYYAADTHSAYILDHADHSNLAAAEKGEEMNLFRNSQKLDTNVMIQEGRAYIPASDFAAALNRYYYNDVLSGSHFMFDESAQMADGEYVAVGLASRGWVPQVNLTVTNGQVEAVTYNEYHEEDGRGKKNDEAYNTNWQSRYPEANLEAAIDELEATLLAVKSPVGVDTVSGATSSTRNFLNLTYKAMAQAKAAHASVAVDFNYRDGQYVVVGLTDGRGWTPQVDLSVVDGKIVSVEYTEYNAEGESKRLNGAGYLDNWMARYEGVDPAAIIAEREAQLIKTQDPNLVDVATGATNWGNKLKLLSVGALNQARMMDAEVPVGATMYVFHGEPTAKSAYYVQLLAVIEDGQLLDVDYVEYQTGGQLAKPHNPEYIERWAGARAELLDGRNQLDLLQEMLDAYFETHDVEAVDAITGATNWGKGIKALGPKVVNLIQ